MSIVKAGLPSRLFGTAVKHVKAETTVDQGAPAPKAKENGNNVPDKETSKDVVMKDGAKEKPPPSAKVLEKLDQPLETRSGVDLQARKNTGPRGRGNRNWESRNGGQDSDSYGPVRRGRRQQSSEPYGGNSGARDDWDEEPWEPSQPRWTSQRDDVQAPWRHDMYMGPAPIGSQVFVRNLPKGVSGQQLRALCNAAGIAVTAVQVDSGPLPTATVNFQRQDAASTAAARLNGQWLAGVRLKVSVKEATAMRGGGDDEFWRKELKTMPKAMPQDLGYSLQTPKGNQAGGFLAHNHGRTSIFDRMG